MKQKDKKSGIGLVKPEDNGPEREFQGDERESVIDTNRSRASDIKENDLGERAGMGDVSTPNPSPAPEQAPAPQA